MRGYVLRTRIVCCKACCSMLPTLCINPGNLPIGPRSITSAETGVGSSRVRSKLLELPDVDDESEAPGVGHCFALSLPFPRVLCCLEVA